MSEIEFALNEYGSVSGTGCTVSVIANGSSTTSRIYEVTMGGDFAGKTFTVSGEGAALQGTATVACNNLQLAAGSATAIQAIWWNFLPNYNSGRQQVVRFSRGGVTSSEVSLEGTISKAAIEAAVAQVVGANKVTVTMGINGEFITVVLKWNDLGTQVAVSASSLTGISA